MLMICIGLLIMATPRKPNGRDLIDYREAVTLIGGVKEDLARQIQNVLLRIDTLDVQGPRVVAPLLDRLERFEQTLRAQDEKIESLELSRAEGKGRAAVVAGIVAFGVTVLGMLISLVLNRASIEPAPAPTVYVTLAPQAFSAPAPQVRVVVLRESPSKASSTPPEASETPSASPTPSQPPGFVCGLVGDVLPCPVSASLVGVFPGVGFGLLGWSVGR